MKRISILLLALVLIASCFTLTGCTERYTENITYYITHHEIIRTRLGGNFDVRFYIEPNQLDLDDVRDITVITTGNHKFSGKKHLGKDYFDVKNIDADIRYYFEVRGDLYYDVTASVPADNSPTPDERPSESESKSDSESEDKKDKQPIGLMILLGVVMVVLSGFIQWLAVDQLDSGLLTRVPLFGDIIFTFGIYLAYGVTCGIIMTVFAFISIVVIGLINSEVLDFNDIF